MPPASTGLSAPSSFAQRTRRRFASWWRRQSPDKQDRFATVAPLVSVLLFLAAIIAAFWYLRNEELERETESVKRDTEIAQQAVATRLFETQEQLARLAREIVTREVQSSDFISQAAALSRNRPEITHVSWVNGQGLLRASYLAAMGHVEASPNGETPLPSLPTTARRTESDKAFAIARDIRQPRYSGAFRGLDGAWTFQLQVPLVGSGGFAGVIVVEYNLGAVLRHVVPAESANRHPVSILDESGAVLASTITAMPGSDRSRGAIFYDAPLTPALNGLVLRSQGYRTSIGLIGNTLFWMVVALSVFTVWMLLGTMRHVRRRGQIQAALVQETNFRRAMENSLLTGMRALDLDGRITYVNAAFCEMSGFTESELIGCKPPYPYWPGDRIDENTRLLQQEMQGRSPPGGIEVRMQRRDGQQFDARLYVSPLRDARGQQTGWMTSMTNITEAKRIRDQLSASHERFTTVLEGLDASVSVLSVQHGELLFANRSYRLWFGAEAKGHLQLAGGIASGTFVGDEDDSVDAFSGLPTQQLTEGSTHPREVYIPTLAKWFDVRSRYVQWTDGRLAQMVIATDISARLRAEEQAAQQAEKAQVTSRLVTMGEMASSVAHELNQPLTAITNYCNGMVSRVEAETIAKGDLIAALQKTARQAERAGQIIHRIRAFVKRSEPQRQSASAKQIVEDAVDLAGIELRRRGVAIQTYVAQRLPPLMVDPILIEQVLLNLLKNAAEAIDAAGMPPKRRGIELRVVPRYRADEGGVIEFSVTDSGPGLHSEVINRLYEAFFSTKPEGLGIGLSLCRSIIESHQGRMRAENLYNSGALTGCRFSFTLPVDLSGRAETIPAPLVSEI
jgi:PAS domain S-box-containing protein